MCAHDEKTDMFRCIFVKCIPSKLIFQSIVYKAHISHNKKNNLSSTHDNILEEEELAAT